MRYFRFLFFLLISYNANIQLFAFEKSAIAQIPYDEVTTVKIFIQQLGNRNYKVAYDLSKVKAWGDYAHFSSTAAFGGIIQTRIDIIEQLPNETGKAVVYVEAFYADEVNGNNNFKQKFYLQQFGNNWKIVGMKLVQKTGTTTKTSDYSGSYGVTSRDNCCTEYRGITISKVKGTIYKFELSLVVGSDDEQQENGCGCEFMGDDEGQIAIENGKATYKHTDEYANYTYIFEFKNNTLKITAEGDTGWRYYPDGIYKKK